MRYQQNTTSSDSDLDNDSAQPSGDINDIAYAAAKKGNIVRVERLRKEHPNLLHYIGAGIQSHGNQPHYLEKIRILTLLQHTTHAAIDGRAAKIRGNRSETIGKWFMFQTTDQTVIKAHNALSLKRSLRASTDEACDLVHSGNWCALVLLANLTNGHIHKKSDKNDFLPFMVWARILEFTLGINNRLITPPTTEKTIWECSLMAHLGNFFGNLMRPTQDVDNDETAPRLPFRRAHS